MFISSGYSAHFPHLPSNKANSVLITKVFQFYQWVLYISEVYSSILITNKMVGEMTDGV